MATSRTDQTRVMEASTTAACNCAPLAAWIQALESLMHEMAHWKSGQVQADTKYRVGHQAFEPHLSGVWRLGRSNPQAQGGLHDEVRNRHRAYSHQQGWQESRMFEPTA